MTTAAPAERPPGLPPKPDALSVSEISPERLILEYTRLGRRWPLLRFGFWRLQCFNMAVWVLGMAILDSAGHADWIPTLWWICVGMFGIAALALIGPRIETSGTDVRAGAMTEKPWNLVRVKAADIAEMVTRTSPDGRHHILCARLHSGYEEPLASFDSEEIAGYCAQTLQGWLTRIQSHP